MHPTTLLRHAAAFSLGLVACCSHAADAVDAKAMLSLAEQSGCLACHAIDKRKVGPSYAEIAQRYHGQPGALQTLQRAILDGHSGTWGIIPMPAYGGSQQVLTEQQARDLARWVLSLAPAQPGRHAPKVPGETDSSRIDLKPGGATR